MMNDKRMLPDEQLMAYLDGEASPDVVTAIAAEPEAYAAKLALLRDAQTTLATGLASVNPPDDLALGALLLGLSDRATARRLHAFIALHPHAARRVALLEQFLADVALPEPQRTTLGDRVRVMLAQLAGNGPAALSFGLRGDQEGVYSAGEYQIVIESDTDLDAPGRRVLTGLLTGPAASVGGSARLWTDDGEAPIAADLDAFGNFSFSGLESGSYELIVSVAAEAETVEIHVQNLQIA